MVSTSDFLDILFPEDIAFGASGGPSFNTSIAITRGGHEVRNRNWAKSRMLWNVAHGIKTQAEFDELMSFFYVIGGQDKGFKFKDHTDFRQDMVNADTARFVAQGDGTTQIFQLVKRYTFADQFYDRNITRPVEGTVRIFLMRDTDDLVETMDFTMDYDTGLFSLDQTTPLDPIEEIWSIFDFTVPVRFDMDTVDISLDDYQNYNWPTVNIIALREPSS